MHKFTEERKVMIMAKSRINGCTTPVLTAAAAVLVLSPLSAVAQTPTQAAIASPGGFVSSCAYSNAGSGFTPGSNLTTLFGAGNCNSDFFSGSASASASRSYSATDAANSAWGSVALGAIHMSASNNASNGSNFAAAASNGGWSDFMTVDKAGLTGQAGIYYAKISVKGAFDAHGFAGSTSFTLSAYKNNAELMNNVPGFYPGSQISPIGTDRQRANWGVATYGYSWNDASAVINDEVIFAVPITFGQQFSLGIYGYASAGMRSSSGVPGNSTASMDFAHSILWDGVGGVRDAQGNLVTGYTLTSGSGKNWLMSMAAPVPEPETYASLLAGLALMAAVRRRKQPSA